MAMRDAMRNAMRNAYATALCTYGRTDGLTKKVFQLRDKGYLSNARETGEDSSEVGGCERYCTSCGHDAHTHRNGRCWVDALGEPVTRAWTHIDCKCDGWRPAVGQP